MINSFSGEYAFLSNFYPCDMHFAGEDYFSVEHAYQASKTTNQLERMHIKRASSSADAKKRGKKVTLRENWEAIKLETMRGFLQEKFSHPALAQKLLDTGDEELVEGNWWNDTYWGVCKGRGENHLGKLLMEIRNDIRPRQQSGG